MPGPTTWVVSPPPSGPSDGSWWFLECNPNGQWAWLESEADLRITCAIADLLEKGV